MYRSTVSLPLSIVFSALADVVLEFITRYHPRAIELQFEKAKSGKLISVSTQVNAEIVSCCLTISKYLLGKLSLPRVMESNIY